VPSGQVVDVSVVGGRLRIDPEAPTLFKVERKGKYFSFFFCLCLFL
jgi:hypothetical protein